MSSDRLKLIGSLRSCISVLDNAHYTCELLATLDEPVVRDALVDVQTDITATTRHIERSLSRIEGTELRLGLRESAVNCAPRAPRSAEVWLSIVADYQRGVSQRELTVTYGISSNSLRRGLKKRGVLRPYSPQPVGDSQPPQSSNHQGA